jgi:hypothetical protein
MLTSRDHGCFRGRAAASSTAKTSRFYKAKINFKPCCTLGVSLVLGRVESLVATTAVNRLVTTQTRSSRMTPMGKPIYQVAF